MAALSRETMERVENDQELKSAVDAQSTNEGCGIY